MNGLWHLKQIFSWSEITKLRNETNHNTFIEFYLKITYLLEYMVDITAYGIFKVYDIAVKCPTLENNF